MYAPAAAACHIVTATARNVMARTQWLASDLWETSDPLFAFCWTRQRSFQRWALRSAIFWKAERFLRDLPIGGTCIGKLRRNISATIPLSSASVSLRSGIFHVFPYRANVRKNFTSSWCNSPLVWLYARDRGGRSRRFGKKFRERLRWPT